MISEPQKRRLSRAAQFFVHRMQLRADELCRRTHPMADPPVSSFLKLVQAKLDCAVLAIQEADKGEAEKSLRDALDLALEASREIDFFTRTDIGELPYPVVAPMQRWFKELAPGMITVFACRDGVDYELKAFDLKPYAGIRQRPTSLAKAYRELTGKDVEETPEPLVKRVSVPGQPLRLIPHLAIVAHEAGHALATQALVDTVRKAIRLDFQALKNSVAAQYHAQDAATLARLQKEAELCGEKWLNEFIADAAAFCIAGPAFFFAFSEYTQFTGAPDTKKHPVLSLRRTMLFSRMEKPYTKGKMSFLDVLDKQCQERFMVDANSPLLVRNDDILKRLRADDRVLCQCLIAFFEPLLEHIAGAVYNNILKNHRALLYLPEDLQRDLGNHYANLLNGIPPIEQAAKEGDRPEPVSFVSILNVGWAVLLGDLDHFNVSVEAEDDMRLGAKSEALQELLLKAVELSEIRRQWHEAKEGKP